MECKNCFLAVLCEEDRGGGGHDGEDREGGGHDGEDSKGGGQDGGRVMSRLPPVPGGRGRRDDSDGFHKVLRAGYFC